MSLLITGVSGALAEIVTRLLQQRRPDLELIGADVRPLPPGRAFPGEFYRVRRYAQRQMDEVFRRHKPKILVHLGRIRGTALASLSQRYNQNVLGTRHLLELCLQHGVAQVVVLSTYHVYGAHQTNHVFIREDEPLRASHTFPELADAVELDHTATTFLWRHRSLGTVVLRPVNMVGPSLNNLMSRLLRSKRCPGLLGFDPMMQFLHERDAARAIVLAVERGGWGVFNVAGEGAVPYSQAVQLAGGRLWPVPHFVAYPLVGSLARLSVVFPKHLIEFFRYPCVIDDSAFREKFGFEPEYSTLQTLKSVGQSRGPVTL